jgi:hypothetical protein
MLVIDKVYRPALLDSAAWKWVPSADVLRRIIKETPFQASLVQLLGAFILAPSAVVGFPGVLAPDNIMGLMIGVFTPLLLGGGHFFLGSMMLLLMSQRKWYRPELTSVAWQGSFWNVVDSVCFTLGGGLLLINDTFDAGVVAFIGSVAFLMGIIVHMIWSAYIGIIEYSWYHRCIIPFSLESFAICLRALGIGVTR